MEHIETKLGNYQLTRLLGRGGFANVYLGEHIYLKTPAAIKVLQVQLDEHALEKFLAEARIIAHLQHPNIVPVLEFGIEHDTPYLVIAYAPHGSLSELHPRGATLPYETILRYIQQMAAALQHAHERKIVHRDVKPGNMLVGNNRSLMLSDFGIAITEDNPSLPDDPHETGTIGTVTYMAPEQLHGQATTASDQYALAVVAYEWLCGVPPFDGTPLDIARQHIQVAPPPLHEKVPGISAEIERVVMRALAKNPQERFASVQEFADALTSATNAARPGLLIHSSQPSILRPASISAARTSAPVFQPTDYHAATELVSFSPTGDLPSNDTPIPPASPLPVRLSAALQHIPRRKVVIGLSGLAGVGVVAGLGALTLHHNGKPAVTNSSHPKSRPGTIAKTQPSPSATANPDQNVLPIINGIASRPTLTTNAAGTLDLFVRGADNALWHKHYDGAWHPWESLGGQLAGEPAATSWGADRFDVFAKGADNTLQHTWFDGTWHPWESLGGNYTSDAAAVSTAPNALDVCLRGTDNATWHTWFYNGAWQPPASLGGGCLSGPALSTWGPNRLDVYVRGGDSGVWHRAYDGSWHDWEPLQGSTVVEPAACSWSGRLDVFIRGSDTNLWHKWFDGTTWHSWESFGGSLVAAPAVASWVPNRIDVIGRGYGNALQHTWFDGGWHGWQQL
jgi:serine/threonine protein kinase